MVQALANPDFEKAIAVGIADSVKYKPQLIGSYKYFVAYNANIKKDIPTAIEYCDKILSLDPQDGEALNYKTQLQSSATKPAKPASTSKPQAPKKG
jgi:hypothetical protein